MTAPAKYGRRNVPKMIAQIDALRHAIRAEGTPAIQAAWDAVEEHIDYAYRPTANEQLRELLARSLVMDSGSAEEAANALGGFGEVCRMVEEYRAANPLQPAAYDDEVEF